MHDKTASFRSFALGLTAVVLLVAIGCKRTTPVAEVTVAESGVTINESAGLAAGNDWSSWRGPTGDGVAPAQDLVTEWDESTNIKWRSSIPGRGHSSPTIVGDTVYLASAIDDQEQQWVLAYDRSDGSEKWRTKVHGGGFPERGRVHSKASNANGTIACNGDALFIAFLNSERITATSLSLDGEILWQRELGSFDSKFGYAPSPVVYKSLVIFAADNQGGGYLAAVDAATGKVAWRVMRGTSSSYSSPMVAEVGGRDQLLISGGDAVTSYDPATGDPNWSTPCIADATCGTVVTKGDLIFASGGFPDRETVCLSADGEKLWSNDTQVYEPSMVVAGDYLVAVEDGGTASCWNTESGERQWKKRLGGNVSASPIFCNGLVYAPNLEGDTFVFKAAEDYELISRNPLGDDCYASPAAVDGELYLRIGVGKGGARREQLVCIAAPDQV